MQKPGRRGPYISSSGFWQIQLLDNARYACLKVFVLLQGYPKRHFPLRACPESFDRLRGNRKKSRANETKNRGERSREAEIRPAEFRVRERRDLPFPEGAISQAMHHQVQSELPVCGVFSEVGSSSTLSLGSINEPSSSNGGNSSRERSPRSLRNSMVVAYNAGRPGTSR